jgi:5-methylcytosine-specific restriction protein A
VPEPEPETYDKLEGAKHQDTVTRYERDRGNRKACIAHYGYVCQVCEMDFAKTYGDLGKEFIEVHHLHPVAQGERNVNPITDLIPLCSNCHSMIHRQEDVSDWNGLREKYLFFKKHNNNDTK